jgi:UDP-N-acetylmuramate dehydrogenase
LFGSCEALNLKTGQIEYFENSDIKFGYRDISFKNELKEEYFITSVQFKLSVHSELNINYGSVKEEISKLGEINLKNIRQAIINIRNSKLPDHKVLGNAGSFFKNPVVEEKIALNLKEKYPEMPMYDEKPGFKKLAAGWLIDKCGLKGYQTQNGAAVHDKQALVIVNNNAKSGKAIAELAEHVANTVITKFNIKLEPEVKIL